MSQIDNLIFELERRVILFKSSTTLPTSEPLGYNGDPNGINPENSDGEFLLYYCPVGTRYQEDDGTQWYKKTLPNKWYKLGLDEIPENYTQIFRVEDWLVYGDDLKFMEVSHNLDVTNPSVEVWSDSERVHPHKIEAIDSNSIKIFITEDDEFSGSLRVLR